MELKSIFCVLIIILTCFDNLYLANKTERKNLPEKWVVDTDVGADDAVALSLTLGIEAANSNNQITAITAVNGNTNVDNVCRNILKVLDTVNRTDIPVFKGSNNSLLITPPSDDFFGKDGLGDFEYPNPPSEDLIQKQHAVDYLTATVRENPGEVNILAIGPLTNIALAIRMDSTFLSNIADLVILGGTLLGGGNMKPGVEFNIFVDPEALYIVLNEASRIKKTIRMVTWETWEKVNITMDWRKNTLGAIKNPVIEFLNKAEMLDQRNDQYWTSADAIAALWAIDESLPCQYDDMFGQVEVCGSIGRAITIFDYPRITSDFRQVRVLTPGSIDSEYVKDKLFNVFSTFNS